MDTGTLKIVYSPEFERFVLLCKKRDKNFFNQVISQVDKIIREPNVGKPLRHALKNRRRIHVGSHVLVYEFHGGELRFIDCDHHDKIYKSR